VIPKNNKSYALEKIPVDKRALKKIHAPNISSPPPPPPVISNGPSLIEKVAIWQLRRSWRGGRGGGERVTTLFERVHAPQCEAFNSGYLCFVKAPQWQNAATPQVLCK